MDKQHIKNRVVSSISCDEAIDFLFELIKKPSESSEPTLAQELIVDKMQSLKLDVDKFICDTEKIKHMKDFCTYSENMCIQNDIYNVVGKAKGADHASQKLMLYSHIDTEPSYKDQSKFIPEIRDGRIYGLGAADDKGGVAMMLLAAEAVLKEVKELNGDLLLMSLIGKRGCIGTLSAMERGYRADAAVYIHPAEMGNGFKEIKNYTMGAVDFRIIVRGKAGHPIDIMDSSEVNAIEQGAKVIEALVKWDQKRRNTLIFSEGAFKGTPKSKLSINVAYGGNYIYDDPLDYTLECNLYFGMEETAESVIDDLQKYLAAYFSNDEWLAANQLEIQYMDLVATPAYTDENSQIVTTVKTNIASVKSIDKFIYQYYGASDIRIPIVYGNMPTVGIGPLCGGVKDKHGKEWIDINDYIDGIKILSGIIIDWCL